MDGHDAPMPVRPLAMELEAMMMQAPAQAQVPWSVRMMGVMRIVQVLCALATLAATISIKGFSSDPVFSFLVAAITLQCVWTATQVLLDLCALLLLGQWPLQDRWIVVASEIIASDGVTAALSFFAASAASGVTMLIADDLKLCPMLPCARLKAATWMGFASCATLLPTLLFNWHKNAPKQ